MPCSEIMISSPPEHSRPPIDKNETTVTSSVLEIKNRRVNLLEKTPEPPTNCYKRFFNGFW